MELSTFDCLTESERTAMNRYKKAKKGQEESLKQEYIQLLEAFPEDVFRVVEPRNIFIKNKDGSCTKEYRIDKQIALFESELLRLADDGKEAFSLITDVIFLDCSSPAHRSSILKQIIKRGLIVAGEKYIFYSSSTGQMKNGAVTLLKESFYKKHEARLFCGLSNEIINETGGINTGKYLAYLSLNMSNSIVPEQEIGIDEVIIVPDFETDVRSKVNYLDVNTLEESVREMDVPILHTDGAGMFIPGTFKTSCQIRGGWIKGAVFPFDFHKFILEHKEVLPEIKDVWGDSVSIEEILNAKMILTASQLKMWRYYPSLQEYRDIFKRTGCQIVINNEAHKPQNNSMIKVAYQALQTIPRENITDEAIEQLCAKSIMYINAAKEDPRAALQLLGVDNPENGQLDPLRSSLLICPELLNDKYIRKGVLHNALRSERKFAQSGKLLVNGIWSYICPDVYAFCEWLLLGHENPKGLIPAGTVYNSYYEKSESMTEVCCIRYPHLSDCEHGMRALCKTEECREWFHGYDTIISTHDLLTKTLQADVDGDHIALISDHVFTDLVDRSKMPLYYEMKKGADVNVTDQEIFECLIRSFGNEGIGDISNVVTKVFNETIEPDIKFARIMCAYNNYVIDYPKSQAKLDLQGYAELYEDYKIEMPPHFFHYAKKKQLRRCMEYNSVGNVDRISRYISNMTREGMTKNVLQEWDEKFNPELLRNHDIEVKRNSKEYKALRDKVNEIRKKYERNRSVKRRFKNGDMEHQHLSKTFFWYVSKHEIAKIIHDREVAANYLLDMEYYLYEMQDRGKEMLWNCFGDILFENLKKNKEMKNLTTRRMAYQSQSEREKEDTNRVLQVIQESEKNAIIPVSKGVYDWAFENDALIKCRIEYKRLLYILCILAKRQRIDPEKPYQVKIYKNVKKEFFPKRNNIDRWLTDEMATKTPPLTARGMSKLEDLNLIKVNNDRQSYFLIKLCVPDNKDDTVMFEVKAKNPLVDLYRFTGEKTIKKCEICGLDFVAVANRKTCSTSCSRSLELRNKNATKNSA